MNEIPETGLRAGKTLHNFTISRIRPLELQSCLAVEAVHGPTGAKLLHLLADDDENLFAIAFKTPPPDDTGIPHILEHSVLGGSEKYPVKDPFVELLKMSMATFINAMTYDDRTVYPVSSNVRKDFFNLVDVYCDAVLHPRITRETLMQEGHHLALLNPDDPESPLTIKGIVYNEMKGAYSSPDSLMMRTAAKLLFPDSPYGRDAGGDPERIPELTYEQFVDFYKTLYHPANARIFLYGDIPTEVSGRATLRMSSSPERDSERYSDPAPLGCVARARGGVFRGRFGRLGDQGQREPALGARGVHRSLARCGLGSA
jgi:Zn-dependent M16 (insulinase) family peptidase